MEGLDHYEKKLIRETESAVASVQDKHGIEEFMKWMLAKYKYFNERELRIALDAWCESKSRSLSGLKYS